MPTTTSHRRTSSQDARLPSTSYQRVGSSENEDESAGTSSQTQVSPKSCPFTFFSSPSFLHWAKIAAALTVVGLMLWGFHWLLANPDLLLAAIDYAKTHPWKTIPIFWLLTVISVVLLLPGGPFQIAAGAIWGIGVGSIAAGSACLVANTAAFAIGRFAFRDSVSEFITRKVPAFPAIEKAVAREGMRLVLLLRLSPVLPDSLMNYCLSLMSIEMSMFVIATAISLVPYTLLYAYLGSISSDIIKTLSGGGDDSGDEESGTAKALRITGIAVSVLFFVGMVWYIGVVIKKAVDDDKDSPGGRKDEEKKDCEEAKPLL